MQDWTHKNIKIFTIVEYRPCDSYRDSNNIVLFFIPTKEKCSGHKCVY